MGNNEATALRRETVLMLEGNGYPVEYSQHEDAPSQHEIDLRLHRRHDDGRHGHCSCALVVKEMAARKGILATFMPKPLAEYKARGCTPTSLCSTGGHQRLLRRFRRVPPLHGGKAVHGGRCSHHASENNSHNEPMVNSYKRLIVSQEDNR